MLSVQHIAKAIRGRPIVDDVSLHVRRGEVVGLLGPNGAGKTTVFHLLTGAIPIDSGYIQLDGTDMTHFPLYERARRGLSYLPQEPSVFRALTTAQNIEIVIEALDLPRAARDQLLEDLLAEFRLTALRDVRASRLSGGERRRCEIARSLASGPSFILLDEPFAGVDPIAVNEVRRLLRHLAGRGIGVLVTDHNVRETLNLIDRAYIIDSGRVLMHGTAAAVLADAEVRRIYLGSEFAL
ncbi:MAG TPA: LPS export ABC transporter ATP-binding protein [Xanthobacteraceae bacterium]|nr:LPS export ABC transporter ATP-binding protein [Xanthobacteraceae bacterium]